MSLLSLEKQMEVIEKSEKIFEEFEQFTSGVRCLFLIQRHKEGGETNNSKLIKKITRNSQEWLKALRELLIAKEESPFPLRIYSCVNDRNFNKAIRKFKYEQLEADYYDQLQKENFYLDIKNRFIGCLMQPQQKASSYFLFDFDNVDKTFDKMLLDAFTQILSNHTKVIKVYPTKNGYHIITEPFNYTEIKIIDNVELKKDALLLIDY